MQGYIRVAGKEALFAKCEEGRNYGFFLLYIILVLFVVVVRI